MRGRENQGDWHDDVNVERSGRDHDDVDERGARRGDRSDDHICQNDGDYRGGVKLRTDEDHCGKEGNNRHHRARR